MVKDWLRRGRDSMYALRYRTWETPPWVSAYAGNQLRWGLLGTGAIARKFARGIAESHSGRLVAVSSRRKATAEQFATEHPARVHDGHEKLLADPEVQAVYISTPHPFHAEWAIKAAEAGKHILCEKPLTMNHTEALAVIAAACANGVFLMEGFMYRCHPQTACIRELIRSRAIGDVRLVQASFSFHAEFDPSGRLFNRALGGGGILDIGCYCVSMARLVAGAGEGAAFADPIHVSGSGVIGPESGVDEYAIASLAFENGVLAQLVAGVRLTLKNEVTIWGTEGNIHIPSPWVVRARPGPAAVYLQRGSGQPEKITIHADRGLYALEADHVAEHLEARQSPATPWADSLGNMRALDGWRDAIASHKAIDSTSMSAIHS